MAQRRVDDAMAQKMEDDSLAQRRVDLQWHKEG